MTSEETEKRPRQRVWLAVLPALVFLGLALLFWRGLSGNPSRNSAFRD
jgi:hypothetical protein